MDMYASLAVVGSAVSGVPAMVSREVRSLTVYIF
jgi:hypothetical protein